LVSGSLADRGWGIVEVRPAHGERFGGRFEALGGELRISGIPLQLRLRDGWGECSCVSLHDRK